MTHLIISFKSRNDLYGFAKILKSNGIYTSIISTPKIIGSTCTLSIRTDFKNLNLISSILQQLRPRSLLGLYSAQTTQNGEHVVKFL